MVYSKSNFDSRKHLKKSQCKIIYSQWEIYSNPQSLYYI